MRKHFFLGVAHCMNASILHYKNRIINFFI